MRHALIGLLLTATAAVVTPASAQISFGYSAPGVHIGVNLPVYPALQPIPGYPVYYAPGVGANYFFYDGLYWVFDGDNWYESPWYNGPWSLVDPYAVPVFLLRVPVRYYAHPPSYFRAWAYDAAPRWGDHWGHSWSTRRAGWDRWNRNSVPAAAPLPTYQRSYSGSRYPVNVAQQAEIQTRSYTYQPRDTVAVRQFQERRTQARTVSTQDVTRERAAAQAQRQQQAQQTQVQRQERVQQTQVKQQQREQQAQVKEQRREQQAQSQQQQRERQAQHQQDQRAQQAQRAQAQQQKREDHAQAQQQKHEQQAQVQQQRREQQAERKQAQRVQQAEREERQQQQQQQQHENRGQGKAKGHDKDNG